MNKSDPRRRALAPIPAVPVTLENIAKTIMLGPPKEG